MPQIQVAFNRTSNSAYVNYAKLDYEVSYTDNPQSLRSTAVVVVRFYVQPDAYTYTYFTSDRLYLGLRRGTANAELEKWQVESATNRKNVYSGVMNYVGTATFTVAYDSTKPYQIFLAAVYENDHTWRFAPFVLPQSDGAGYTKYDYKSGNNGVTLERRFAYTPCTSPGVNLSPALFENSLTLSFGGAGGGVNNPVTGFEAQYSLSPNNRDWGAWEALGITSAESLPVHVAVERGHYLRCRVRALGGAGAQWASPFSVTQAVCKNTLPKAPATLVVSPLVYGQGQSVQLSFAGAADPDGGRLSYELQAAVEGGSFATVGVFGSTSIAITPTGSADLERMRYRVRAVDSLGLPSGWVEGPWITRDDPTGIAVCQNGGYKKARVYVCRNGTWTAATVLACKQGGYAHGL